MWRLYGAIIISKNNLLTFPVEEKCDSYMELSQYFNHVGMPISLDMDSDIEMDMSKKYNKSLSREWYENNLGWNLHTPTE